jgi:hypothetical protein
MNADKPPRLGALTPMRVEQANPAAGGLVLSAFICVHLRLRISGPGG